MIFVHHVVEYLDYRIQSLCLPLYVIRSSYLNESFDTFVNGFDGSIAGLQPINPFAISTAASVCCTTAALILAKTIPATLKSIFAFSLTYALLPFYVTYLLVRMIPAIKVLVEVEANSMMERADTQSLQLSSKDSLWTLLSSNLPNRFDTWTRAEVAAAEAKDYQNYRSLNFNQASPSPLPPPRHPDVHGYYAVLGLKGKEFACAKVLTLKAPFSHSFHLDKEIKNAFFTLAKECHPDSAMQTFEHDKSYMKFHLLSDAYSVLKDRLLLCPPSDSLISPQTSKI